MAVQKETAEQKLLKIIENAQAGKGQASAPGAPDQGANALDDLQRQSRERAQKIALSVKGPSFPAINISDLIKFFSRPQGTKTGTPSLGLKDINKFLLLATLVLAVWVGRDYFNGMTTAEQKLNFLTNVKSVPGGEIFQPLVKDIAAYLSVVETRNIFKPYEKVEKVMEGPLETRKIASKVEKLKLVGISWQDSAESASVMIEDGESGLTFFLKQGETVRDVSIKTIYADRVILSFEGEEMTFRL